jgi:ribonuclease P protein component
MIKRENRLRLSRHIKRAFDKGLSWQGGFFRLRAFKNRTEHNNPSRLAVIVSKKFSLLATERNLFRRRVRSAFKDELNNLSGWDIVVLAKNKGKNLTFEDLEKEVKTCADLLQSKQ